MWKVAQAAIQGRGHISGNIPCQDKTFYVKTQNGCAIALADGAGSAKYSHLGAKCTVEYVSNLIVDHFEDYYQQADPLIVRHSLMTGILKKLERLAESIGCEICDLASTLLCVAVYEDRYLIVHLGDGVIGYGDGNSIRVASFPNNGEFCNSTVFTTSIDAEASLKLLKGRLREEMKGFVLFSDGVGSVLYKHNKNEISQSLSPVFDDLAQHRSSEVEQNLLETLDEIKARTQDDCSIIVMAKRSEETPKESNYEESDGADASSTYAKYRKYMPVFAIGGVILLLSILMIISIIQ